MRYWLFFDRQLRLDAALAGEDADKEVLEVFDEKFNILFDHLSTMQHGTSRIRNIVNDLRSFSRMNQKEMKRAKVLEGLKVTLNLVKANYKENVTFETDFQGDPEIECSPPELNQVFMNVMVNACQAIVQKNKESTNATGGVSGTLAIQSRIEEGHVVLCFQDTGTGMSPEVQKKMFDPFFSTKPEREGTGLGLSISANIIRKHHGRFDVKSEIGKGTSITLYLPLEQTKTYTVEEGLL